MVPDLASMCASPVAGVVSHETIEWLRSMRPITSFVSLGVVFLLGWLEGRYRSAVRRNGEHIMLVATSLRVLTMTFAALFLAVLGSLFCSETPVVPWLYAGYAAFAIPGSVLALTALRHRVSYSDSGIRFRYLGILRPPVFIPWTEIQVARDGVEQLTLHTFSGKKYPVYIFMRGRGEFDRHLKEHHPEIEIEQDLS